MNGGTPLAPACASARRLVHRALDGETLGSPERAELETHLSVCSTCRELREDLVRLRDGLRALPTPGLPDGVRRAVRAATGGARRPRGNVDWRPLAAAAALAAAMLGLWGLSGPAAPGHDPADVRSAEQQTRLVLKLTAQALQRSERAALGEVLAGEVSPALQRVPIDWPAPARGRHDL